MEAEGVALGKQKEAAEGKLLQLQEDEKRTVAALNERVVRL
jgi:hypothetical protein